MSTANRPWHELPSLSLVLIFASLQVMTMSLLADGPADNSPDTVRRVPPVGIAISESVRQELSAEVKALETNLAEARLRWSRNPQQLKHWADIAIFGKSVDWALRYREIFKTNEVDSARLQLKTAAERLQALDKALLSATLWNYSPDNSNEFGVYYFFLSFCCFVFLRIYSPDNSNTFGVDFFCYQYL
jgi:hypothetical protein